MHDIRPYLPELFSNPGSLLYIGARVDAHSWLEELLDAGNKISILEVWYDNVISIIRSPLYSRLEDITEGDVKEIGNDPDLDIGGPFDYIFWWHGPEHLSVDEIKPVLATLEAKTRHTITLACPWGIYPQGAHEDNPYEEHKTALYPEFFTGLGYEVVTDGEADKPGSEIVAWKRLQTRLDYGG